MTILSLNTALIDMLDCARVINNVLSCNIGASKVQQTKISVFMVTRRTHHNIILLLQQTSRAFARVDYTEKFNI